MTQRQVSDKYSQINKLLSRMDKSVADSFSHKQRKALQKIINTREWKKHDVDFRPTLALPFLPWNFYIVFLFGVNRRDLAPAERMMAMAMFLLVIFFIGLLFVGGVFVLLYLLKSWLGIDFFPDESLGLWDAFKRLFD